MILKISNFVEPSVFLARMPTKFEHGENWTVCMVMLNPILKTLLHLSMILHSAIVLSCPTDTTHLLSSDIAQSVTC